MIYYKKITNKIYIIHTLCEYKKKEDSMNKKSGFTLAEVLVTLMIIGVIASMTIPSLMQNTAQQEFKAAYKKAISTINQAVTLNYALDGEDATIYQGTQFMDLLKKRLNVMSESGGGIYTSDGMFYTATGGGGCTTEGGSGVGNQCAIVTVDVNGPKGPNKDTLGSTGVYDQFKIAVYPQRAVPESSKYGDVLYAK